ncbi:MAG TPA: response regulator [Herpetosiphonaceae bacterium]
MSTVLVVDDSPVIRLMVSAALGQIDLAVSQAGCGAEALAICGNGPIAAVLLDMELPGENGLEICHALKRDPRTAAIPVILMSGHAPDELEPGPNLQLPDYFLAKPFSIDQIQSVIRQAMA